MKILSITTDGIKGLKERLLIMSILVAVYLLERFALRWDILQCPIYKIIGLPCPVCGSTRATNRLFAGDIKGAFNYNPAILLIYLAIILFVFTPILDKKMSQKGLILICSFIILIYCIGMLFIFPNGVTYNINPNAILQKFLDR